MERVERDVGVVLVGRQGLARREAGLRQLDHELRSGVRARHGAERLALERVDAVDERAVLHHDDGVVGVVRGREVEVLLPRFRDGIARHEAVDLAVLQHVLAVLGQHAHELHRAVAHARGHLVRDVDLEAVVLARALVEVAEAHHVASHAHAQRLAARRRSLVVAWARAPCKARQRARKQRHCEQQRDARPSPGLPHPFPPVAPNLPAASPQRRSTEMLSMAKSQRSEDLGERFKILLRTRDGANLSQRASQRASQRGQAPLGQVAGRSWADAPGRAIEEARAGTCPRRAGGEAKPRVGRATPPPGPPRSLRGGS